MTSLIDKADLVKYQCVLITILSFQKNGLIFKCYQEIVILEIRSGQPSSYFQNNNYSCLLKRRILTIHTHTKEL